MISFRQQGDFSKLTKYLQQSKDVNLRGILDQFGREGVAALASATPVARWSVGPNRRSSPGTGAPGAASRERRSCR